MTSPEWHPDDERLLGRYVERRGDDEPLDRHLANCSECLARYRSLERTLEHAYADVAATADAVFPPTRLEAQRHSVLLRLGQREHGRVLPFPERRERSVPRTRLAVAAAALILMTTTGLLRILSDRPLAEFQTSRAAVGPPIAAPQSTGQEAAYLDIETALARHGTAELQALDDLTPRATGLVPPR